LRKAYFPRRWLRESDKPTYDIDSANNAMVKYPVKDEFRMNDRVFATDLPRVSTTQRARPDVRLVLSVLLVCAGYYIGALAGKSLRFPSSNLALIWPPTAILLSALLLAPRRTWWIYLLAAAPVHILVQLQDGVPVWAIISLLLGNFSQAVLAALIVHHFNKGAEPFDSFRAMVIFILGAVIVAPMVVSSMAAYLYVLSGWEHSYRYAWGARVLSNALSTLMIVPLIIVLANRRLIVNTAAGPHRYVEAGALVVALVLTGWIAFSKEGEAFFGAACPIILPLPVLLWSAVRFRLKGLCLCLLLVAYLAFMHAADGHGFFAMNSPEQNVLSLQFYLILIALPLMLLAILIEERGHKQETLRQSEARYRALALAGPDMVWRANATGKGFFVTPTLQDLTGQNEEQMRDFGWLEAVHPDDRERSKRLWQRAMRDRHAYENEVRVRTREGNYRHFHVHAVPVIAPDGSVYEWVGANTDITDRKRAEDALRQSENQVRLFVEHTPASVAMFDREMRYVLTSRRWLKDYNLGDQNIIGRSHYDVFPEISEPWKEIHRRCLAGAVETCDEDQFARLDGTVDWIRWEVRPWYVASGEIGGIIIFTEVITDRKRAEEEIRQLKERLEAENVYLRAELSGANRYGELTGQTRAMQKVLRQVKQVAPTDMTVLVLGETGTGKELVARLVHEKSGRGDRPLVKVNCSALPAELIESELFGHERGAFTGAVSKQIGRFELADGGTLFLDEIGEFPLRLQSKLLRVLQEGEFERLGSGKTIKVDVRVIAATNRNLSEAVRHGRFRADLYYRLNVYPIEVPPLRERREDIGLLAEIFLQEAGRRLGKNFGKISGEVIEALQGYSWPGNVRELENVISRAAVTSIGSVFKLPEGWKAEVSLIDRNSGPTADGRASSIPAVTNTDQAATLGEMEKAHIVEVLHRTNWRIEGPKGAAVLLGLHPNTLRSRMRKLGIQRPVTNNPKRSGGKPVLTH
jgi:PAS domain S-box-containing protein